jgi:hypothetical protein
MMLVTDGRDDLIVHDGKVIGRIDWEHLWDIPVEPRQLSELKNKVREAINAIA